MKIFSIIISGILLSLFSCQNVDKQTEQEKAEPKSGIQEVSFYTPDSIQLFGDLYEVDKKAPTILLFHQGGSNARGEYAPIIPRLREKGFNILAIDQRVGGQIYGNYNRTIANIPEYSFGDTYTYCDAYNNLESALDFVIASGFTGNKILWGSSYSATLVIQLAHERPEDTNGVLSFSPASGRQLEACHPNQYFETLQTPLLILRPPNEMENENTRAQLELAAKHNHQTYAAQFGIHGSSMLVKDRVGHEVEENWKVVMRFLDELNK